MRFTQRGAIFTSTWIIDRFSFPLRLEGPAASRAFLNEASREEPPFQSSAKRKPDYKSWLSEIHLPRVAYFFQVPGSASILMNSPPTTDRA